MAFQPIFVPVAVYWHPLVPNACADPAAGSVTVALVIEPAEVIVPGISSIAPVAVPNVRSRAPVVRLTLPASDVWIAPETGFRQVLRFVSVPSLETERWIGMT